MTAARWLLAAALALLAIATSVWVWHLHRDAEPAPLVGPPRSDYLLFDFDLVALDEQGRESFSAAGPRLARHPHLGTLEIDQPRFSTPDAEGGTWRSRAERAFVDAEGDELRLVGNVVLHGPDTEAPLRLSGQSLNLYARQRRVASDAPVTITQPGSILTTNGLRGDLDTRSLELLSRIRLQHEPTPR